MLRGMKKGWRIAIAVLVAIIVAIIIVERVAREPEATLADELLAAASALPDYEKVLRDGMHEVPQLPAYNHLNSLGSEGVRLALRMVRRGGSHLGKLANALALYKHNANHVPAFAGLLTSNSGAVRAHGVWLLGTIPETAQHAEVLKLLVRTTRDSQMQVRRSAAITLPRLAWPEADRPLAKLVEDSSAQVAEIACLMTRVIACAERFGATADALARTVQGDGDEETILYAATGLVTLIEGGAPRTATATEALKTIASHKDEKLAARARKLLATPTARPK